MEQNGTLGTEHSWKVRAECIQAGEQSAVVDGGQLFSHAEENRTCCTGKASIDSSSQISSFYKTILAESWFLRKELD